MKCECGGWEDNQPIIDSALVLYYNHGFGEINKSFSYCPYCGKELKNKKAP